MKLHFTRPIFLLIALIALSVQMHAGSGIFQTYAVIDANGTGNQFLAGGINSDSAPIFSGLDFGAVTSLVLNGGEMKTYKNDGSDVFGAEISYNVHLSSGGTGSFTTLNLPFNSDLGGGDQKWQLLGAGVNLISGLTCGTYDIEVFWKSPSSDGDHYDSNGGGNFTATFTIADTENPTITCPSDITEVAASGEMTAIVNFADPVASDLCSSVTVVCTPASGSAFPIGMTTVTCTATDDSANSSVCTFTVTVNPAPPAPIALTPTIWGEAGWQTFPLSSGASDPACGGDADDAVWFSFVANSVNDFILAGDPAGGYNPMIELFDAFEGTSLGCYEGYGAGLLERALPGDLVAGQEYFFRAFDAATGPSASTDIRVMVKTFEDAQLQSAYCDISNVQLSQSIYSERDDLGQLYSNPNVAVNGYRFNFKEQGGPLDVTAHHPNYTPYITLSNVPGLEYGKTYDVSVEHRILVNVNGNLDLYWSDAGTVCTITTASAPGSTYLNSSSCGATDLDLSNHVQAVPVSGATQYEFTFVNGPQTIVKVSNGYTVQLYSVGSGSNKIQYGLVYNVTVRAKVNGIWSAVGASCSIGMNGAPAAAVLQSSYRDGNYDFPGSNYILATQIYGATEYTWEFTKDGDTQEQITPGLSLAFHLAPSLSLTPGAWSVRVKAKAGGVYNDYSTTYTININGGGEAVNGNPTGNDAEMAAKAMGSSTSMTSVLYPNPNRGDQLNVVLTGLSGDLGLAQVQIFDITGKLIHADAYPVKGEEARLLIEPSTTLSPGSYIVRVNVEGSTRNIQLMVN